MGDGGLIQITVVDAKEFARAEKFLADLGEKAREPIMHALNRAADGVPVDASRMISEAYNVTKGEIKKGMMVSHASRAALLAVVLAKGRPIPLYKFGARPSAPGKQRSGGVSVEVMQRANLSDMFVARMKSGHVGVFKRTGGAGRTPIHELFGPGVAQMFNHTCTVERDELDRRTEERFNTRLDHEIGRMLAAMGVR